MKETGTPRVLVAESDVIVALDLCVPLQEAGERVAGRLANVAATEALLEGERIDLTVLDPLLEDDDVSRTLWRVPRRGVTFVLQTTCHREGSIARGFGDAPCLAKPEIP